MERKNECKVVQDLLLGYVDDTLNEISKNLVERHLKECGECREKLNTIKEDIQKNEQWQKKEIDYLKKIRRKSIIKSILIAVAILMVLAIGIYLIKFIKINSVFDKSDKSLKSNNMYIERIQPMGSGETSVEKIYFKDGKYKSIWENYSDEGKQVISTTYATVNGDEIITINDREKQVSIEKGEFVKAKNQEYNLKYVPFMGRGVPFIVRLGTAFVMSIHTDTYDIGREYYVLKNQFEPGQRWEVWIDKQTGLPLKEINKEARQNFYPGTNITKEVMDMIQEYEYKFDIVTDEDVQIPDYSGYEVKYIDEINLPQ